MDCPRKFPGGRRLRRGGGRFRRSASWNFSVIYHLLPFLTVPYRPSVPSCDLSVQVIRLAVRKHHFLPVGGRSMLLRLLAPVVLALAFPLLLCAQSQSTTGIIRGVVTDPAGTPVAGATVVLHELQTGFQRQLTTNERGVFIASLMPLGVYDVTTRAVGYGETKRADVRLGVGQTVDLTLPLAAVQLQAVVVEATQPVVEASKTENSTRLPNAAIARPPHKGRHHLNLTLATPHASIPPGPPCDP